MVNASVWVYFLCEKTQQIQMSATGCTNTTEHCTGDIFGSDLSFNDRFKLILTNGIYIIQSVYSIRKVSL